MIFWSLIEKNLTNKEENMDMYLLYVAYLNSQLYWCISFWAVLLN